MAIKFYNETHEQLYSSVLSKMKKQDHYHQAAAYLLTLDSVCYEHINELFNFERDEIKVMGTIYLPWQTYTSEKTTRLIFNLWSGVSIDFDEKERVYEESQGLYSVNEIFACSYAPYYCEAIKLRFPDKLFE